MSRNRTRGLLRAAALLAVGASPMLASAASATEGPTDVVDGKLRHAPEVGVGATKPVTDLLGGHAVKLPTTLPGAASDVRAPRVAAPAGLDAPTLPLVGDLLGSDPLARDLPQLPGVEAPLDGHLPALPDVGALPVQAPTLG